MASSEDRRPFDGGDHPDDASLAAFLDGVISDREERSRMEGHLADCAACREEALAVSSVLISKTPHSGEASSLWTADRSARWAAAASLLLVASAATFLLLWQNPTDTNAAFDLAAYEHLTLAHQTLARDLLQDGIWPSNALLEEIPLTASPTQRISVGGRPELLEPRWSTVSTNRPEFFFTALNVAEAATTEYEIHLLDRNETPMARWIVPPPATPTNVSHDSAPASTTQQPIRRSTLPQELTLKNDHDYIWKINVRIDGDLLASTYSPFHVASNKETRNLRKALRSAKTAPLVRAALRASAADNLGAAKELLASARTPSERNRAHQLATQLYLRSGIERSLAHAWIEHLDQTRLHQ